MITLAASTVTTLVMCTPLTKSPLLDGVRARMARSSGMCVTPGVPSGVSKDSSAFARVSTTSLLSQAAPGLLPKIPGLSRSGIRLRKRSRMILTMTQLCIHSLSQSLTQRLVTSSQKSSFHAGRAAASASLNSSEVRKSMDLVAGNFMTSRTFPKVSTGETRTVLTICLGARTSISPSTVVPAGPKPLLQLLPIDSTS